MCLHPHSVFLRIFHRSYPCVFHSIYRTFGNSIFSNLKTTRIYSKNMGHVFPVVTGHRCLAFLNTLTHMFWCTRARYRHSAKTVRQFKSNAVEILESIPRVMEPITSQWNTGWWLNQPILNKYARHIGWFPPIISGWKFYQNIFQLPPPSIRCTYRNQVPPGDNWKKILPQLWPPASFWGHPTAWKKHAQASEHSANIAPFLRLDFFWRGRGPLLGANMELELDCG